MPAWLQRHPFADRGFGDAVLANAFMIADIPYRWEKGIIDRCPEIEVSS